MRPVALPVAACLAALTLPLAVIQSADATSSASERQEGSCASSHWVATWTASPSDAFASVPLVDQTIRQQIFTHYAGTTLRLHLTNRSATLPSPSVR